MAETIEDIKKKILDYLGTVDRIKIKEVPGVVGADKKTVDKAIGELAKEGKVEYLYLETSYIKLVGKPSVRE